jgi:hypothetical protein
MGVRMKRTASNGLRNGGSRAGILHQVLCKVLHKVLREITCLRWRC